MLPGITHRTLFLIPTSHHCAFVQSYPIILPVIMHPVPVYKNFTSKLVMSASLSSLNPSLKIYLICDLYCGAFMWLIWGISSPLVWHLLLWFLGPHVPISHSGAFLTRHELHFLFMVWPYGQVSTWSPWGLTFTAVFTELLPTPCSQAWEWLLTHSPCIPLLLSSSWLYRNSASSCPAGLQVQLGPYIQPTPHQVQHNQSSSSFWAILTPLGVVWAEHHIIVIM